MKTEKPKAEYNTIEIEATEQGWIVTEKGQQKKIFFQWRTLLNHIESRLSTK
jgi:hypothetical protein